MLCGGMYYQQGEEPRTKFLNATDMKNQMLQRQKLSISKKNEKIVGSWHSVGYV